MLEVINLSLSLSLSLSAAGVQVQLHIESTHLVGGNPHGRELDVDAIQELKSRLIEEERTAIWTVVALHIQAG